MWDSGYVSFVPKANEMAMSNFRPVYVSNIVILLFLEKITRWVIKWFQISLSWEIHLLRQQNLSEHEWSAGTLQCTQQSNHLKKINHSNNKKTLSVFFLKLMKYPPLPLISPLSAIASAKRIPGLNHWVSSGCQSKKKTYCCCISLRRKRRGKEFWKRRQSWVFKPHGESVGLLDADLS